LVAEQDYYDAFQPDVIEPIDNFFHLKTWINLHTDYAALKLLQTIGCWELIANDALFRLRSTIDTATVFF
jgi:hypothetical protein